MFSLKRRNCALFLMAVSLFLATTFCPAMTLQIVKGEQTENKNVILIGWDGVQRNHLFELLNRSLLPNLASFANNGSLFNITVSDHGTDTKAGWTQILTGYRWWRTGVFNNVYWFHSIPAGYTIPERVENYFGRSNVTTGFIVGKLAHMEIQDGTGDAANGRYTLEAIYRNLPSALDVCTNGNKGANVVGPSMLQFLENNSNHHFFAFFHFSDPDSAGHNPAGGENSVLYEQAIELCDNWLGQILNKLNALNITQKTLVYLTADHGFDEGGYAHNNAPYVFLATNDKKVTRNGDEVDVAPTIYYGLGMWGKSFDPALDGYPLQVSLPEGVEQERQSVLDDITQPSKASIVSPTNGANLAGTVSVMFNASDRHLSAVLLLISNTLKADSPWTWHSNDIVEVNGSYTWDTTNISPGSYTITILVFDEHGANNSPSTSTITVSKAFPDQTPPTVSIVSPVNKTYTVNHVSATFIVSEASSWIGYSLDNQETVTIAGNTILTGLSDGTHSLIVYAKDMFGNVGSSGSVYFRVDTSRPSVSILSPENKTYAITDIQLIFKVNEPVSMMAYSLNRQVNVTIAGNTTLAGVLDGLHSLAVYATDTAGNTGASETIYFTIAQETEPLPSEPSQTGFLGSSLPIEYGYGIVATLVVAVAATGYLFLKRKK